MNKKKKKALLLLLYLSLVLFVFFFYWVEGGGGVLIHQSKLTVTSIKNQATFFFFTRALPKTHQQKTPNIGQNPKTKAWSRHEVERGQTNTTRPSLSLGSIVSVSPIDPPPPFLVSPPPPPASVNDSSSACAVVYSFPAVKGCPLKVPFVHRLHFVIQFLFCFVRWLFPECRARAQHFKWNHYRSSLHFLISKCWNLHPDMKCVN